MSRLKKKIVLWCLGAFALLLVLLTALLLLAPWIINQRFVKEFIVAAVSQTLGGRISYDRLGLSLFPRPHLAIRGARLSIPGSLSGTLTSLDLYAELRPLLTGELRITSVRLDHPDVTLTLSGESERPADAMAFGMPNIATRITQGRLTVMEDQRRLFSLQNINMQIDSLPPTPQLGNERPAPTEPFHIVGSVQGLLTDVASLPGPVSLTITRFDAFPRTISFSDARVRLLDAPFVVSGTLDDYLTTIHKVSLTMGGTIGPQMVQWIRSLASLPPELTIHAPITLSRARLLWNHRGTMRLEGTASVGDGLTLSFDLLQAPGLMSVKQLRIRDRESQAAVTLSLVHQILDLTFSGNLSQTTMNSLFEHERFQFGWVKGDLSARIDLDQPLESTAKGTLEGERLVPPFTLNVPVIIDRISLSAAGRTITLKPLVIGLGAKSHTVTGTVTASADGWRLDLKSDGLEWEPLQALFAPQQKETPGQMPAAPGEPSAPVRVTLRLNADSFSAAGWTAQPFRADIAFDPDATRLRLSEAGVCGIHLSGTATVQPEHLELNLRTTASRQPLAPSLNCLSGTDVRITGTYDLSGAFTSQGEKSAWFDHLRGGVVFTASNGRIYHDLAIVKVLEYLNTTDLLKGKFPDPEKEGVPYQSALLRGSLKDGVLRVDETVLVSPIADITGRGSINLSARTIDTVYLVAPFPSADAVVKKIPLLKDILGGSLLTIPVRVQGPYENPTVTTLPTDQVADELGGMMKRLLGLPFKLIQPILP